VRHECEARTFPEGDVSYVPWLWKDDKESVQCCAPAVEYFEYMDRIIWLCAEHWDTREAILQEASEVDYDEEDEI
jgi:hypothetical protein